MKTIFIFLLLLASVLKSAAQEDLAKHLITDFGQTSVTVSDNFERCSNDHNQGNCATIALVKAAVAQFKTLKNIFKEFKQNGDSFYLKFNDDIEATISKQEIDIVKQYSGIANISNSVYYDSSMIVYTAICKRVLVAKNTLHRSRGYNNPDCIVSFRDAVDYISSGYPTATVCELLGLKFKVLGVADIVSESALIINDSAHAAYCSNGIQDILGKEFSITENRMKNPRRSFLWSSNGKITGVYKLLK